jgi:O-antigen/teichoic acid export membrane protein
MIIAVLKQKLRTPLYQNAIGLIGANALGSMFGLLFWIASTRWLYGAYNIGLASAVMAAVTLLGLLATMGLDFSLIRFLPGSNNGGDTINTCYTVSGLASIVLALVFISGVGLWCPALEILKHNMLDLFGFVVFTAGYTLYSIQNKVFVAQRKATFCFVQNAVYDVSRVPLLVGLATAFAAFGIVGSWGIAVLVAFVFGLLVLQPRTPIKYRPKVMIRKAVLKEMVRYSLANYASELLWLAPITILPMMVVNRVGAESNAYFYIAWVTASILFSAPIGITFSLFAEGSHDENKLGADTRKSFMFIILILVPAMLIYFLLGHTALGIFSPEYAARSTHLLWILTLSAAPLSLNYIYTGLNRVHKTMAGSIVLNAWITVVTLVLSWILLPRIGISGAGIGWLVGQSTGALALVVFWVPGMLKKNMSSVTRTASDSADKVSTK